MAKVSGVRKAIEYAMRTAGVRNQMRPFRGDPAKQSWEWPGRHATDQLHKIDKSNLHKRIGLALGGAGVGAGVIAYRSKGKN
jgi:hypothetical protein